jgi:hypothetical protein
MPVVVDDRKWRDLAARVANVDAFRVKVGVLAGSGEDANGTSYVEIAAFQEFGTSTLPERSFVRATFRDNPAEVAKVCERLCKAIVLKGMNVTQALELLGQWAAARVRRTITSNAVRPPDAPATIAAKGSSTTLVDTGGLVNAVSYEVAPR